MTLPDPDFLVESIPNTLHGTRAAKRFTAWTPLLAPMVISAAATALLYQAAGFSLGLFLGGLFWATLFSGPFITAEKTWFGKALATIGVIHGIAGVWLYGSIKAGLPLELFIFSYATLSALVVALAGMSALLQILKMEVIAAGGLVTVFALAWLFWPIWLAPALHGDSGDRIVAVLVPAHPVFAINAVLRERLGYWVEQAIAYHYTNLSDDVSYSLPRGVWPSVALHVAIGVVCLGLSRMMRARSSPRA